MHMYAPCVPALPRGDALLLPAGFNLFHFCKQLLSLASLQPPLRPRLDTNSYPLVSLASGCWLSTSTAASSASPSSSSSEGAAARSSSASALGGFLGTDFFFERLLALAQIGDVRCHQLRGRRSRCLALFQLPLQRLVLLRRVVPQRELRRQPGRGLGGFLLAGLALRRLLELGKSADALRGFAPGPGARTGGRWRLASSAAASARASASSTACWDAALSSSRAVPRVPPRLARGGTQTRHVPLRPVSFAACSAARSRARSSARPRRAPLPLCLGAKRARRRRRDRRR